MRKDSAVCEASIAAQIDEACAYHLALVEKPRGNEEAGECSDSSNVENDCWKKSV